MSSNGCHSHNFSLDSDGHGRVSQPQRSRCLSTKIILSLISSLTLIANASLSQTWRDLLVKADSLMRAGQTDSAVSAGRRGLRNPQHLLSSNDTAVAALVFRLAKKYRQLEVYDLAERCYDGCVKIRRRVLGSNHLEVANGLNGLALMMWLVGRNDEAEEFNQEALSIRESLLGKDHLEVSESLTNLGLVLLDQRRYKEAQELLIRALLIDRKNLGNRNLTVALSQLNLGNAFYTQADYNHAEEYYMKALSTREELLGKQHPEVAQLYDNLGACYEDQGRTGEAETLYKKALTIFQDTSSGGKRDLAICLQNLGIVYTKMYKLELAEKYLVEALELRKRIFQSDNPEVAVSYANLAELLLLRGRHLEAESLYTQAIPISNDHERLPMMMGLANLYRDNASYVKAESLYKHTESLWHHFSGVAHPQLADFLESYSLYFRYQGNTVKAVMYARLALHMRRELFTIGASVMSERDALTYSSFINRSLSNYLSCTLKGKSEFMASDALPDWVLSSKGVVSDLVFERRRKQFAPRDSFGTAIEKRLRNAQVALVRLYAGELENLGPETHKRKLDSLSTLCNKLESQNARRSAGFRKQKDYQNVTAKRIASLLPPRSTLVEYLKWDYLKLKSNTTIAHYLAVVLDRKNKPHIADLGEADRIDRAINRYRQHLIVLSEKLAKSGLPVTDHDQVEYASAASVLYKLVWQPVETHIKDQATVFIAPDGGLNLVSFAGMLNEQGEYLIEKYPLHYLSAGRDLVRLKDRETSGTGLIAFGDPDYDASVVMRLGEGTENALNFSAPVERSNANNVRSACGTLREIKVGRLFDTRQEVVAIAEYWKQDYHTEPAVIYTDSRASEENFRMNSHGKRVIHLATHGYFIQSNCLPKQQRKSLRSDVTYTGENPLLLSGLFLAGSNLHGVGSEDIQAEDGIVTALEVSAMDLSGTDLVVLSACETGLGEVRQGEGVYGLRRAFQIAGARTIVSALWRVPDSETKSLMKAFYAQKGTTYPELMQKVALQHIHDLRLIGRPTHPYSWGGFIATGDWRRK